MQPSTPDNPQPPEGWLAGGLLPLLNRLKGAQEQLASDDAEGKFDALNCAIELAEKELDCLAAPHPLPFGTHLEKTVADLQKSGLSVTLQDFASEVVVISAHAMQCLCVLREACANAVKHGDSTRIAVVATQDADRFVLSISDQGRGLAGNETACGGIGMDNMKRRAAAIGGELHNIPNHLGGLTLELRLPVEDAASAGAAQENPLHQQGRALHDGYCQCLVAALVATETGMESLTDRETDLWQKASVLEAGLRRHLERVRQLSHDLCAHREGDDLPSLRGLS